MTMIAMAEDPDMLRELCKYQIQELRALKQQLEDCKCAGGGSSVPAEDDEFKRLKAENDELKMVLAQKDEELDRLRLIAKSISEDVKPKIVLRYITTPVPPSESEHHQEPEEGHEKDPSVDWETKYRNHKAKYKIIKTSNEESKETLKTFRVELDKAAAFIKYLETEPNYHRRQTEQKLGDFLQRRDLPPSDGFPPVENCKIFAQSLPAGKKFITSFYGKSKCPNGVMVLNGAEMLFCATGDSHTLVLQPSHRFNGHDSTRGFGFWQRIPPRFVVDHVRDIFHRSDAGYAYIGSYKCISRHDLDEAEAQRLHGFLPEKHGSYLTESLIAGPDLIPPHTARAVRGLYGKGVVGVVAFALERVAFDQSFSDAVFAKYHKPKQTPAHAASGSKRARGEESQGEPEGRAAKRHELRSG